MDLPAAAATALLRGEAPASSGGGKALPAAVRAKMEASFGADFSAVRIHEGPEAAAMGAEAYTQGTHIYFAPGKYDPDSPAGQELLGHELTHVVQQSQGRAPAGAQAKGAALNADAGLEREADDHGARAARGQTIGGSAGPIASTDRGVVQRKAASELRELFNGVQKTVGISTQDSYLQKCVAGYIAHSTGSDIEESMGPGHIIKSIDWENVDIPDQLCTTIEQFPAHYVPTNVKVWKDLFDRIDQKRGKLKAPEKGDIKLGQPSKAALTPGFGGHNVDDNRKQILKSANDAVGGVATTGPLSSKELELYNKIMRAKLTMNIPLDKLFDFRSPHLLNGIEVGEQFGKNSNNTTGKLGKQRAEAEEELFGIPQSTEQATTPGRVRPRYAALNFKGHPTGAAARNDYGLSYLVLSSAISDSCTLTIGDSFNSPRAKDWSGEVKYGSVFPFNANGVKAMVKTIFALENSGNDEMNTITDEGDYNPNDNYIEVQIHNDVDLRSGVDEIWVSKVEMAMFEVPLETVTKLIKRITDGAFQLVQ